MTADVDNDGDSDIVGRNPVNGQWWVARSNGTSGFANELWGSWAAALVWQDLNAADVDGDDDIVGRSVVNGQWWVARSNGASGFVNELWGGWNAAVDWQDVLIADVDGDNDDDIVGRSADNGQWWVARSNGTGAFVNELWGVWNSAVSWTDVNGLEELLLV